MRAALLPALLLVLLSPEATAASVTVHARAAEDGSLSFVPADVIVRQGDEVTITLVNDDPIQAHDWALLGYAGRDVEAYTLPGETKSVTFTASEAGTFRVVCQVVSHKQSGMQGHLIVQAATTPAKRDAPLPAAPFALAAGALVALALRRRG